MLRPRPAGGAPPSSSSVRAGDAAASGSVLLPPSAARHPKLGRAGDARRRDGPLLLSRPAAPPPRAPLAPRCFARRPPPPPRKREAQPRREPWRRVSQLVQPALASPARAPQAARGARAAYARTVAVIPRAPSRRRRRPPRRRRRRASSKPSRRGEAADRRLGHARARRASAGCPAVSVRTRASALCGLAGARTWLAGGRAGAVLRPRAGARGGAHFPLTNLRSVVPVIAAFTARLGRLERDAGSRPGRASATPKAGGFLPAPLPPTARPIDPSPPTMNARTAMRARRWSRPRRRGCRTRPSRRPDPPRHVRAARRRLVQLRRLRLDRALARGDARADTSAAIAALNPSTRAGSSSNAGLRIASSKATARVVVQTRPPRSGRARRDGAAGERARDALGARARARSTPCARREDERDAPRASRNPLLDPRFESLPRRSSLARAAPSRATRRSRTRRPGGPPRFDPRLRLARVRRATAALTPPRGFARARRDPAIGAPSATSASLTWGAMTPRARGVAEGAVARERGAEGVAEPEGERGRRVASPAAGDGARGRAGVPRRDPGPTPFGGFARARFADRGGRGALRPDAGLGGGRAQRRERPRGRR